MNLGESLARKHFKEEDDCECGEGREDVDHVLWKCMLYDNQRNKMIDSLKKIGVSAYSDYTNLITKDNPKTAKIVAKFFLSLGKTI